MTVAEIYNSASCLKGVSRFWRNSRFKNFCMYMGSGVSSPWVAVDSWKSSVHNCLSCQIWQLYIDRLERGKWKMLRPVWVVLQNNLWFSPDTTAQPASTWDASQCWQRLSHWVTGLQWDCDLATVGVLWISQKPLETARASRGSIVDLL